MRPKGNGLVELVDEKPGKERGFFCMDLVSFMWNDASVKPKLDGAPTVTDVRDINGR